MLQLSTQLNLANILAKLHKNGKHNLHEREAKTLKSYEKELRYKPKTSNTQGKGEKDTIGKSSGLRRVIFSSSGAIRTTCLPVLLLTIIKLEAEMGLFGKENLQPPKQQL